MDMKITTLEGKEAGSLSLSKDIFGLEPRADLIQRYVNWQLAKRQAGTHKTKDRNDVMRTGKKMYAQKGTGGARHGSARAPNFRGGARVFGPVVRSHAHDLPKKVRALALRHALSAKAKDGGIVVLDKAAVSEAKTKALAAQFGKLGLSNALIVDGATLDYDVIIAPVITEKATMGSEYNKVMFKVARTATKPQIKEAVEKLFDVKVKSVNTLIREGKIKAFKGRMGQQSDVKRAIVTLEEGHRIDVTTGL
jgi:large subunit ribosomal protein L4